MGAEANLNAEKQRNSSMHRRRLDQERAASMADEGGVSGAYADARERGEVPGPFARAGWQPPAWLPWALSVAGAFWLGRWSRR